MSTCPLIPTSKIERSRLTWEIMRLTQLPQKLRLAHFRPSCDPGRRRKKRPLLPDCPWQVTRGRGKKAGHTLAACYSSMKRFNAGGHFTYWSCPIADVTPAGTGMIQPPTSPPHSWLGGEFVPAAPPQTVGIAGIVWRWVCGLYDEK